MQDLQGVGDMLFPAEDAEGDGVDDDEPDGNQAQLGADLPEVLAFCGEQAQPVNDRGQRQEGSDMLQPVRHEVAREEGARQEHHWKGDDITQWCHLALVLGPAPQCQADAKNHDNTKHYE